jgi:hypothetical protein
VDAVTLAILLELWLLASGNLATAMAATADIEAAGNGLLLRLLMLWLLMLLCCCCFSR